MDLNSLGSSTGNAPRKVRFKPKAPPKREQKLALPKAEKNENDVDEVKAEQLLRRYKETSSAERVKPERKVGRAEVAFGIGASSRSLKSYGFAKDFLKKGDTSSDGVGSQSVEKEYKEPWDYYSNYPTTLPMRRPYSGNPELLDQEEFGDDPLRAEYVDNVTNVAEKLDLLDNSVDKNIFMLNFQSMLPAVTQLADSETPRLENKPNYSKGSGKNSQRLCQLESLPEGCIGKMVVYKSGAVKLKLGDILYNVYAGLESTFGQEFVVINRAKRHCVNFGELNKRTIVTPDIDSMLDSMSVE